MSIAIPIHIALIDQTGTIDPTALQNCAGALNEQIQSDLSPVWGVRATVGVYQTPPPSTWQIVIKQQLDEPGALGYHTDTNNQPISYVELTTDWTVTVSHECLEMLVDPFGNRLTSAAMPNGTESDYQQFGLPNQSTRVHYLLEACDPCESTSYRAGGVAVSDFLLPAWYRTYGAPGIAYSKAEGCFNPREVADGGYVSFCNDAGEWYQVFNQGGKLSIQDLGKFDSAKFGSLREFTDSKSREFRAK